MNTTLDRLLADPKALAEEIKLMTDVGALLRLINVLSVERSDPRASVANDLAYFAQMRVWQLRRTDVDHAALFVEMFGGPKKVDDGST